MNITMTGNLGSGKTSVCKELKEMGYEIISAGGLFRQLAAERGMSVVEFNKLAETDKSIDKLIDERSTRLGRELSDAVFDSRLAWHFVEESFKVFLMTDVMESARRVYNDTERSAESYASVTEAAEALTKRTGLEKERFKSLYDVDYYNKNNYDLIIESTKATPRQIAEEIVRYYEEFKMAKFDTKVVLNTGSVIPAVALDRLSMEKLQALSDKYAAELTEKDTLVLQANDTALRQINGYTVVDTDIEEYVAATKAGYVFMEVAGINNACDKSLEAVSCAEVLEAPDKLNEYETYMGINYTFKPSEYPEKQGYTIDLSTSADATHLSPAALKED